MRRSAVLAALLGVVAYLLRQARLGQADKDVWTAATAPPDLR